MKQWKTTLIVLVVFAAILAYVLLVESKKEPPPDPDVSPSPTPVPLLDATSTGLRAVHATDGTRTLRLERQGENWQIVEPGNAPVDPVTAGYTLDDLADLRARLVVLDELADPATYGLDPAALTLTIETTSGTRTLIAGREAPDGTAYYAQIDGDPRLYLIDHYRLEPFFRWLSAPPYAPTPTPTAQ
jgi:hypothetical protein